MKTRKITIWVAVTVLALFLFIADLPAVAAPVEELKLVQALWGSGVPIPRLETTLDWLKLLYDPLFGTTPDGKLSPEHGLVVNWERSPDALTWTWKLRQGVKFHDGVELTAKDVKFTLEQVALPDSTSEYSDDIRKTIGRMEIKDPYTLVIHCKKPSAFFINSLTDMASTDCFIMPKEYYERVGKDQFMKRPIGTGSYKWHSQVVGSYIRLEATEKHWRDGVPRFKYVTFMNVPEESTRLAMLKTGQADIARISRDKRKEMLDAGLNVISKKDAGGIVFHCTMIWATPAFSDIRFRKALNLAIDKEAIIKAIFERSIPIRMTSI